MSVRWIAEADATVGAIVARAGGDAGAIADGRVFVGRRRARDGGEAVRAGDEVTIAPPRAARDVVVLAQTPELVAVAKPAGIPTIADHHGGGHALLASTARAIGAREDALHATSRLDRDVSGVVVFALSRRGAERLARARAEGKYERRYVAIAAAAPAADHGAWDASIGRAKDPRHRAVGGRDPTPALTRFRVVARAGHAALLALAPITGRTHQLRVHAAHAGAPLLGDRTYGGPARVTLPSGRVLPLARVALHCARVAVPGFATSAPIPDDLRDLWLALGGDASAWDTAVSCLLVDP